MKTVDRALSVLASFSDVRQSWSVTELAESFDLTTSTSQRVLSTLAESRFLSQDPGSKRYSLGPAAWRASELYERSGGLARFAETFLRPLAIRTGMVAQFTVPDGAHVRCIAAVDGLAPSPGKHPWVGDVYPAFAGATPRAYFAFLPASERQAAINSLPLVQYTTYTPVDVEEIHRRYAETAERGWAHSINEYNPASEAIGAPVLLGNRPRGSISIVRLGPAGHDQPQLSARVPLLLSTAAAFAAQLTSSPTKSRR